LRCPIVSQVLTLGATVSYLDVQMVREQASGKLSASIAKAYVLLPKLLFQMLSSAPRQRK